MSDSNTKSRRQLGPVLGATLTCQDIDKVSQAYIQQLDFTLVEESTVSEQLASFWQAENLVGNRLHILKAANGDAWLRLLEDKNAKANQPLKTHGWMSLETNVGDVDAIAKQLQSDFEVIGAPAYLQVSDAIKAMQVIGPAGEVSYLTQVEREVPPFELPMTKASSGSLFIPVLSTPNREQSLAFYEALHQADQGLKFPTKVTVLNNAWGKPIDHQYDVATLQLAGKTLFEIDQVVDAAPIITNTGGLPSGIAMISIQVNNIEAIADRLKQTITPIDSHYLGRCRGIFATGAAGELIELLAN